MTTNAINWFEIPVTDIELATAFYSATLGYALKRETFLGVPHAIFAAEDTGVAGALIADPKRAPKPSTGTVVYLATTDVTRCLTRARAAGGQIIVPRTEIPFGIIALIADPDGNVVGLHSEPR